MNLNRPTKMQRRRWRWTQLGTIGGFTIVEQLVALAVLGVGLGGAMRTISYMQFENRASSQRMLAASIQSEILELFKTLPYDQITNSTAGNTVYLKQLSGGGGDPRWKVPASGQWQAVPVEDVNSSTGGDPASVDNKLPSAVWSAEFATDAVDASLRRVTVTMQWRLYAGGNRPPATLRTSTMVSSFYPNL